MWRLRTCKRNGHTDRGMTPRWGNSRNSLLDTITTCSRNSMSGLDDDDDHLIHDICLKYVPNYTIAFYEADFCANVSTLLHYVTTCSVYWNKFRGIATQLRLKCHDCTSTFPAKCLRQCIIEELKRHTCQRDNVDNSNSLREIFAAESNEKTARTKNMRRNNLEIATNGERLM